MLKSILKLVIILFLACSKLGFAQETPPKPSQTEKGAVEEKKDFFEEVETAPLTYKGAFIRMILTLLGLIVLIVLSVWMLRRISHTRMKQLNYGRNIKILERRPLSAKSVLYLVEISGKKVVIAESQLEVRPITSADNVVLEQD